MMCSWGLYEWGDIANIIIAIASVVTAIVTARMLIKQHNLQKEQHKLEQAKHELESKKFEAQKQEHQPNFYFKRYDDRMEICNKGVPLAQPIEFWISSMLYIETTLVENHLLRDYIYCCPIRVYEDECRCQEEVEGVVAICPFDKERRNNFHTLTKQTHDALCKDLAPKIPQMTTVHVMESDLIKIQYVDMYQQKHTLYYHDSMKIDKDTYSFLEYVQHCATHKPHDPKNCDITAVLNDVAMFRFKKM